jgi:isocitrate dehydrogenase (NAD+)
LNLTLRRTFNLFANVRPCVSIQGFKTPYDDVNTVLIRENTEGEYSGIEHEACRPRYESLLIDHILLLGYRWSRAVYQAHYLGCFRTCGSICLSLCAVERKEKSHSSAQGKYHVGISSARQWSIFDHHHRKMSDGMFLSACRQVAKEFPDVAYDEDLLDRVCLHVWFLSIWNFRHISERL